MGWWRMDKETGGISCKRPSGAGENGLVNAVPGRDTIEDHYGGDQPADRMGEAIHAIRKLYQEKWGREPYIEEMDGIWTFCMGHYRREGSMAGKPKAQSEG